MRQYSTIREAMEKQFEIVEQAKAEWRIAQNQFDNADNDYIIVATHRLNSALERYQLELSKYKQMEVKYRAELQTANA